MTCGVLVGPMRRVRRPIYSGLTGTEYPGPNPSWSTVLENQEASDLNCNNPLECYWRRPATSNYEVMEAALGEDIPSK